MSPYTWILRTIHVFEDRIIEAILRQPSWHRFVGRIHRSVHERQYGRNPHEPLAPGEATVSSLTLPGCNMKSSTIAATVLAAASAGLAAPCNGSFGDISAADWIAASNPGWNLGNTLDAIPTEGSWNNPPVVAATFDAVKAAGFNSVRIPVTYTHHFLTEAPDYTVDPAWLQRVEDVIDMALDRELLVMTNVHHDSWEWADVSAPGADIPAIQDKFYKLWVQIATKLAYKSSFLAFESINEPPGTTAEHAADINQLNALFLDAIAEGGGYNTRRVVTLSGPNHDPVRTSQWFEPPADIVNPWALQFHYYSPYDFTFSAWGRTVWGSDADMAAVDYDFGVVRGNFTDVPLYIGEYDASPTNTESAARWRWFDHVGRAANDINAAVVVWDNGLDHLIRETGVWRDPSSIDILVETADEVVNSLPDSTVDTSASEQFSSAFIWNQVGQEIADVELPWLFNGNTLESITQDDGTTLVSGTDYTTSADAITFTAAFIGSHVTATSEPGVYATLTLSFSAGADILVRLVQWDTPVLGSTSSTAVAGTDLRIPIEWQGLPQLATVRMIRADGTILFDDWTIWLGPLQQGRGTFDGQWAYEEDVVILRAATVNQVISGGQPTTFTFEFYPRVADNTVEYTLNV
ncbi:hypothetical protein S7711_03125 [Stachybotrys chartarum IBT 7711]|uniref:Glycoside hydrolase family 5 domain-containing protein n=1 Tax=Stachybotrys chartarum (strain CBS 109288 / IBT 7711) TaxID=1280523 RepID=A0A084B8F2_STACB|nr:hypothetical protein S7711_03125 [Stachybotrys chartarum IBT 7711]